MTTCPSASLVLQDLAKRGSSSDGAVHAPNNMRTGSGRLAAALYIASQRLGASRAAARAVLAALGLTVTCTAWAQSAAPVVAEASLQTHQVKALAAACANCHGTDGALAGLIPAIAGRPAGVLEAQLLAFKKAAPSESVTVMDRIAKGYTDDELRALAAYYASRRAN